MNGRTIVVAIVVVALAILGYYYYQHRVGEAQAGGQIHWVKGQPSAEQEASFKKENSGGGADAASDRKPLAGQQDAANSSATASGDPNATPASAGQTKAPETAPSGSYGTGVAPPPNYHAGSAAVPATDSESFDAPNGAHFGGNGNYQWYRQGNLTWRIDTVTGRSCVIYATMEEWRKPIVYNHACGRNQ